MRSVEVVKQQRDIISEKILKLTDAINKIRGVYGTDMMDVEHEIRMNYFRLMGLRTHFQDQRNALNFVLNEDTDLVDFINYKHYKELKVYLEE